VYATNDAPGATPGTTANVVQAGTSYDRDFAKHLFGFVNADFQTDALQNLDLRSVFGGGLGLHAIKSDRTTLDFLGGLNYIPENYSEGNWNRQKFDRPQRLARNLCTSLGSAAC